MNIAIVGGGHAAVMLLECFASMAGSRLVGVADLRTDAEGMVRAREMGIATTTSVEALVKRPDVDLVIEITGSRHARAAIVAALRPEQEVMSAAAAKVMYDIIEMRRAQNAAASERLSEEFRAFGRRLSSARESVEASIRRVDEVLAAMKIIALNAKIEGARAGEAGVAFGVVADEMKTMTVAAKAALETIQKASVETNEALDDLGLAEQKLLSLFH